MMNLDATKINTVFGSSTQAARDEIHLMTLSQLANKAADVADQFDTVKKQYREIMSSILLEAREKHIGKLEFGQWRESVPALADISRHHVSAMLNWARFARNHDMSKIKWTAALELAAPCNKDVAEKVYRIVKDGNLPAIEVTKRIIEQKALIAPAKAEHSAVAELTEARPPTERVVIQVEKNWIVGLPAAEIVEPVEAEDSEDLEDDAYDYNEKPVDNLQLIIDYSIKALKLSPIKAIPLHQDAIRAFQGMAYKHTR